MVHTVFMNGASADRPAGVGRKDNVPRAYGRLGPRLEPRLAQVRQHTERPRHNKSR
jgi:hypothetical protein